MARLRASAAGRRWMSAGSIAFSSAVKSVSRL